MAIIRDSEGDEIVAQTPLVEMEHKKFNYKCEVCKDQGTLMVGGLRVKCGCVVKKEIQSWIKPPLNTHLKRVTIVKTAKTYDKAMFRNVKPSILYKQFGINLIVRYYKKGMVLFPYYIISGDDFTEKYVEGEHNKYRSCESLLLLLGGDNYNKTLQTTMISLILHRERKGLSTWVAVNDKHRATGRMSDLYGEELVELVEDQSFWEHIVVGLDDKTKVVKK